MSRIIKLPISEEVRKYWFEMAKKQRAAGLAVGGTSKFQTKDPIKDHAIGLIGECYVNYLLENCQALAPDTKVMHRWDNNLNGKGDPFDFIVNKYRKIDGQHDIVTRTIDCKTGYLKEKDNIEIALKHFNHYINAKQLGKAVDIYMYNLIDNEMEYMYYVGWIWRKEVISTESFKPKIEGKMIAKASCVPISSLSDDYQLLTELGLKMSEKLRRRVMGGQRDIDDAWGC